MSLLDDNLEEKMTQEFILCQFHNFRKKHLLCRVYCIDSSNVESGKFAGWEIHQFNKTLFEYKDCVNALGGNLVTPEINAKIETIYHSSLMYQYEYNKLNIHIARPDLPIIIKDYYEESLPEYIKFPKNTVIIALDCNEKLKVDGCLIIFEKSYVV